MPEPLISSGTTLRAWLTRYSGSGWGGGLLVSAGLRGCIAIDQRLWRFCQ